MASVEPRERIRPYTTHAATRAPMGSRLMDVLSGPSPNGAAYLMFDPNDNTAPEGTRAFAGLLRDLSDRLEKMHSGHQSQS
jgi:hypothetical protein